MHTNLDIGKLFFISRLKFFITGFFISGVHNITESAKININIHTCMHAYCHYMNACIILVLYMYMY